MPVMQLTKEQLQDKIFELEMELKELRMQVTFPVGDGAAIEDKQFEEMLYRDIQETMCYISYYKAELQHLEDLKYE